MITNQASATDGMSRDDERLKLSVGKLWSDHVEEESEKGELLDGVNGKEDSTDEGNQEEEQSINVQSEHLTTGCKKHNLTRTDIYLLLPTDAPRWESICELSLRRMQQTIGDGEQNALVVVENNEMTSDQQQQDIQTLFGRAVVNDSVGKHKDTIIVQKRSTKEWNPIPLKRRSSLGMLKILA